MTQDEAANILWWASKRHYPGDQMDITAEDIEAFDMAIAALRSPEHDPDTGAKDAMSLRMMALKRFIGIRTACVPATGSGCIRKSDAQPDPDTGLVPCGCGGNPANEDFFDGFFHLSRVTCPKCGIEVTTAGGQAKVAWSRAMGMLEVEG